MSQIKDWKNDWALITGASSGIGEELARQLAAAGMNLILVARREERLRALGAELSARHGVSTVIECRDLTEAGAAQALHERLRKEDIRVRLLCNNAGIGRWGRFEKASAPDLERIIQVNVTAMISLCHEFLEDLRTFPQSAVINVSSQAALQPVPFMAVYAASKAFIHSFSQALYGEWQSYGITVQALVPGPTATEFDAKAGAYESAVQKRAAPGEVVRAALAALDRNAPVATNVRLWPQRLFAALMPARLVIRMVSRMFAPPT
ncbi:MAG: SDR family oxidoreductase [Oligoflexia bacterium]|nr:SDR family oxidoreductase [Oligoflexia bacterium]